MSGMMLPAFNPGSILRNGGASGNHSGSTPSAATGGTSGSGGGTHVFGNLQGRDPDLLFAGEKIMINGKEVTVADGQTLSSLAAQHGTTVEKLIGENKMDASLLGRNGPNGAYFTPGGPTPGPGDSMAPRPNQFAPGSDGKYSKEQAAELTKVVQQLHKDGKLADSKATEILGLLNKVSSGTITDAETAQLTTLLKDVKAAQAGGASTTGTSPPQSVPKTPAEAQAALNAIGSQAPKGMGADDFSVLKDLLTQLKNGPLSDTQKATLEKLYGRYTALSNATTHEA
jgi:LysM domain